MKTVFSVASAVAVGAIILVAGFLGLSMIFSDLGPNETLTWRVLSTVLTYAIGSLVVGFLTPRRWYLAVFIAWGPVLLAVAGLAGTIRSGKLMLSWAFLIQALLLIPGLALVSSCAGSFVRRRLLGTPGVVSEKGDR